MAKRRYTAEEIVTVLRQVGVGIANGKTAPHACWESGITNRPTTGGARNMAGSRLELSNLC